MARHPGGDGHHGRDHRPAGAEGVHAAVDPRRPQTQRAFQCASPRLRPCPAMSSPGYVDRPSMSSNVSPASATAASQASMVSDSGGTISRRPIRDSADAGDRRAFLELRPSSAAADVLGEVLRGDLVGGLLRRTAWAATGRNSGSQTSSFFSNTTSTSCPSSSSSGSQSMMLVVNRTRGSSCDRDLGDHVGRRQSGDAEAVVDGERRRARRARSPRARPCCGCGSTGTPAAAGGSAPRSLRTPGCAACRRRPRSRRTRSPRSVAAAARESSAAHRAKPQRRFDIIGSSVGSAVRGHR